MSRFEEYELYVRNKDFLQSDRVITFSGADGRLLAMKPDVTLSIVKNAPEEAGEVRKVYYRENVYRQDRDNGNFREILQSGVECVGDVGGYEIAEVVYLAARSLEVLGEQTILSLSHVGLIRHALDESGLPESARKQALDCLGQKREQELRLLCEANNADGALLLRLLRARTMEDLEPMEDCRTFRELREIVELLPGRVRLDFSLGNDMKYYSGLVFKGYVRGVPSHVLSGGQYDRLLSHMGKKARAIGLRCIWTSSPGRKIPTRIFCC
jgi:ATP phosphoribosyltransferase regulatory subunit